MMITTRWEITVLGAKPILYDSMDVALKLLDGLPRIPQTVYRPLPFTRGRLAYRTTIYRTLAASLRPVRMELDDCRETQ